MLRAVAGGAGAAFVINDLPSAATPLDPNLDSVPINQGGENRQASIADLKEVIAPFAKDRQTNVVPTVGAASATVHNFNVALNQVENVKISVTGFVTVGTVITPVGSSITRTLCASIKNVAGSFAIDFQNLIADESYDETPELEGCDVSFIPQVSGISVRVTGYPDLTINWRVVR